MPCILLLITVESYMSSTTLTYQYRIKDSSIRDVLIPMSSAVNFIWNYCNDIVRKNWQQSRFYTDEKLLSSLTKGASKFVNINSQSIQAIYEEPPISIIEVKDATGT